MKKFENEENIFYISTLCKRDVFGRICLKKRGFIAMKGYNAVSYTHLTLPTNSRV